ncbi:MAG: AAA family ATPase [Bacteroidetes bacterium]|nr:AAA family ATPase [Bacteroidota bacterium]MCB0845061.1 AAA family ATPase [Bacteroidota bacterium]
MDDLRDRILKDILGKNDITLTEDQERALEIFMEFYHSHEDRSAYLLTGSAGTGKTFLINIFTALLRKMGYKVILLAPTGRAAKVITRRTKRLAYTIHHHIYSPKENAFGDVSFELKANKEKSRVVYVVDEASMIGDHSDSSIPNSLLRDLLRYVFYGDEQRKIILVGDPVQLPPVGHNDSPALDPDKLSYLGDLDVFHSHLTEVKRQLVDSGVLENAVLIRDAFLGQNIQELRLDLNRDVQMLERPYEALETYMGYFEPGNQDRAVFITYSNYQATKVNQAIRHQIFGAEEPLVASDLLMVVKNNYAWGDPKRLPFIANGEMGTVRDVYPESYEEKYGLKWMDVEIEFLDARGEIMLVECKIVLDLLENKQPQLDQGVMYSILQQRKQEYMGMSASKAASLLRTDPYVNALQVKYGYAITGHKSQGGQWENVIIGFEPDYGNDLRAYIRWTYTVFTRAEERVFLLNCPFVDL